jgi:non-specific serine/threonine protein kinase
MGERASAEKALREALRSARRHGDRQGTSIALYARAGLARERGAPERAAGMHAEALELHVETGDPEAIARSLEGLAGTALDRGQLLFAARLYGAAQAHWKRLGRYAARWPWEQERHHQDVARLEEALGPQARHEAWEEGAARPLGDIVSHALRGRAGRREAAADPAALTRSEREVARLAVRGLTSREVAERLVISPRTVDAHLASVYRKLGISSRRQLRTLAEQLPELGEPGA